MDLDAQWQYCNRSTLGRLFLMEHSDFLHRPSEEVTSCPTRSLWSTPPGPLVAMDHWHHVSYHGSRMFGDCVALCSKNKRPISGLDRLAHCSGTRQRFFLVYLRTSTMLSFRWGFSDSGDAERLRWNSEDIRLAELLLKNS